MTDAVIALAGVALGWLLGVTSAWLRDRRDARMAGRLLLDELRHNARFLETVVDLEGDVPLDAPPRRSAWEGVGTAFLRLADRDLAEHVSAAYRGTENVWVTVGYVKRARDKEGRRLEELKAWVREHEEDAGAEDAEALRRTVEGITTLRDNLREFARGVGDSELPFVRDRVVPAVDRRVYPRAGVRRFLS